MAKRTLSDAQLWEVYEAHDRNAYAAAKTLGLTHSNVARRARKIKAERAEGIIAADLPPDDISTDEIIDQLERRFALRHKRHQAAQWYRIGVPEKKPFGLLIFGDPHLDSNGCDWPKLRQHVEIAKQPGIYGINLGDVLDNWPHGSRLMRLYAHSDQSVETAQKLARWFLNDSGVRWLVHVLGNHDTWGGHTDLRAIADKPIFMQAHGARFVIEAAGSEWRIAASHNFSGNSMWNPLHGPKRAAAMGVVADLYVAGHIHTWGLAQEENAARDHCFWLARAAGYKAIDDHAERLGYSSQTEGASILAVCNPGAEGAKKMTLFSDIEIGSDFLQWLRSK